jgi:hypothetical protein
MRRTPRPLPTLLLLTLRWATAKSGWAPFPFASGSADAGFAGEGVHAEAGGAVRLAGNSRAYLMRARHGRKYELLDLRGKEMRFTVDVSRVHCSCNAAWYLVAMKGHACE